MIKLERPLFGVEEVFTVCINTVDGRNINLINNLFNCIRTIVDAETEFDNKFISNEIHTIAQTNIIVAPIDTDEMKSIYTYRLVQTESGREYYDRIISNTQFGLCPICYVRIADTIDHFLPKAKYPVYSVTPLNLSPACKNCNEDKKVDFPTSSNNQLLHPYYDDIASESWLSANIIRTVPLSFKYYVSPPDGWNNVLKDRVSNHFNCYNLNILYSSHACQELRGITKSLKRKRDISVDEVKKYLNEAYEDRLELGVNAWQPIFYKTLLNDEWFCNDGIELI